MESKREPVKKDFEERSNDCRMGGVERTERGMVRVGGWLALACEAMAVVFWGVAMLLGENALWGQISVYIGACRLLGWSGSFGFGGL